MTRGGLRAGVLVGLSSWASPALAQDSGFGASVVTFTPARHRKKSPTRGLGVGVLVLPFVLVGCTGSFAVGERGAAMEASRGPRSPTAAESVLIRRAFREAIPCERAELQIRASAGPIVDRCLAYAGAAPASDVPRELPDELFELEPDGNAPCLRTERRPRFPNLLWWSVEGCGLTEHVTCGPVCFEGPFDCVTSSMVGRIDCDREWRG